MTTTPAVEAPSEYVGASARAPRIVNATVKISTPHTPWSRSHHASIGPSAMTVTEPVRSTERSWPC